MSAQDGLEQCRRNMEGRERELQEVTTRLAAEALAKRKQGDSLMARSKLMERRRVMKRLERLRQGLELVDTQLDAIKSSELDKEIMLTLKASTNAMRKAGINLGIQEVENVMSELDEQMREAHDVTSVLSNPLIMLSGQQGGMMGGGAQLEDAELDAELTSSSNHPVPTPDPQASRLPARRLPDRTGGTTAAAAAAARVGVASARVGSGNASTPGEHPEFINNGGQQQRRRLIIRAC